MHETADVVALLTALANTAAEDGDRDGAAALRNALRILRVRAENETTRRVQICARCRMALAKGD